MGNNRPNLYIGITNNLNRRVYEHKLNLVDGFTKKYKLKKLLYFENYKNISDAIAREKQLKHWEREWKLELIRSTNPAFNDLYYDVIKLSSIESRMTD